MSSLLSVVCRGVGAADDHQDNVPCLSAAAAAAAAAPHSPPS